jgi:hypothetical protein
MSESVRLSLSAGLKSIIIENSTQKQAINRKICPNSTCSRYLMEKNPPQLQEIVFASSNKAESRRITALLREDLIRKIAPRIYTSNLADEPEVIIKRNWYLILAHLYPDAIVSHRSALEYKPTPAGHIFLTYSYTENVSLPGLTIHFVKGPGKIEGDNPFFENLYVSQEARAFLENLQSSRKTTERKNLLISVIEERLEAIVRARGEKGLRELRDKAKQLAGKLSMENEFKKLNEVIGGLLGNGESQNLKSRTAIGRALGDPFDPDRIRLFESLYDELAGTVFPEHKEKKTSNAYKTFAFFESYFSNYIEGIEFTASEAKKIITTGNPIPSRHEDSLDILGTYRIVSDRKEMSVCPMSPNQFLDILRRRHAILLQARTSKKPGEFKDRNNAVGSVEFVNWQLVNGTLKKGFELYTLLRDPFAKAAYMMFLVSEVHPFLDGNGRIARVMMNADLASKGLSKIIIPTVYREDYIGALRKLTRQRVAHDYVRMLLRAYEFSSTLVGDSIDEMEKHLIECDDFKEPKEGKLKILSDKKY